LLVRAIRIRQGRKDSPFGLSPTEAKEKRDKGALAPFFSKKKEELDKI
jgi:hypothetical protein